MRTNGFVRRGLLACALAFVAMTAPAPAGARIYLTGEMVTNFTLINRLTWTNESGRVFGAGTPLRLSDFDGKVLFMEFFDAT